MNIEPDTVLNSDNGIISTALQIYAEYAERMAGDYTGNSQLIDRARALSIIFRDMSPKQKYE